MRKRDITLAEVESNAESFTRRYPRSGERTIELLKLYADGTALEDIADRFGYEPNVIYNLAYKFKSFIRRPQSDIWVVKPAYMDILTWNDEEYLFILFLIAIYENYHADKVGADELPDRFRRLHGEDYRRSFIERLSKVQVEFTNTGNPVLEFFIHPDDDVIDCTEGKKTVVDLFKAIRTEGNDIYFKFMPQVEFTLDLGTQIQLGGR